MKFGRGRHKTLNALIDAHLKDKLANKIFPEVVRPSTRIKPFEYLGNKKRIACHILSLAGYGSRDVGDMVSLSHTAVSLHIKKARKEIENCEILN